MHNSEAKRSATMGGKRKRQAQDVPVSAPAPKKHQKAPKASKTASSALPTEPITFLEDPKGEDLRHEVHLYEQLSSEDPTVRLHAADAVVMGLFGGEGVSEGILRRHLERRLIRGLASGRKGARLGFSIVLTEILGQLFGSQQASGKRYTGLTFAKVLEMLKAKTKPEGDLSGQEEKDHAFGLLFGLQCFVRAKVLFGDGEQRWEHIFDSLLQLAKKKPWMREECGWIIVEALQQMQQPQAEATLAKLQESGLAASPEGVGIWLVARRRFPDMKFPSKPWGQSGNPLEHLKELAKALKESSSPEVKDKKDKKEQIQQSGNWNAQLHFVWNIVLDQFIEGAKDGNEEISNEFENFWKVAVDGENLYSTTNHAD